MFAFGIIPSVIRRNLRYTQCGANPAASLGHGLNPQWVAWNAKHQTQMVRYAPGRNAVSLNRRADVGGSDRQR